MSSDSELLSCDDDDSDSDLEAEIAKAKESKTHHCGLLCLCCVCILCICGGILVAGLVAYIWRLRYMEGTIVDDVENITAESFGTPCNVGGVDVSLLFAWITLRNYTIGNPPNYPGNFMHMREVTFDVDAPSLIPDNRVRISDFTFRDVEVNIVLNDLDHSNVAIIYKTLWSQPWHFKHLKMYVKRLAMLDLNITIRRPNLLGQVEHWTTFKIDRVMVNDIGKDSCVGGVSLSEFCKIWAHAVWQAILHNAPGPVSSALVEGVNVAMGGKFHLGRVFRDMGEQIKQR